MLFVINKQNCLVFAVYSPVQMTMRQRAPNVHLAGPSILNLIHKAVPIEGGNLNNNVLIGVLLTLIALPSTGGMRLLISAMSITHLVIVDRISELQDWKSTDIVLIQKV